MSETISDVIDAVLVVGWGGATASLQDSENVACEERSSQFSGDDVGGVFEITDKAEEGREFWERESVEEELWML